MGKRTTAGIERAGARLASHGGIPIKKEGETYA